MLVRTSKELVDSEAVAGALFLALLLSAGVLSFFRISNTQHRWRGHVHAAGAAPCQESRAVKP